MLSHPESENNTAPGMRGQGLYVPTGARQIDLHRLDLRFAATRIANVSAVRQLTESIRECGQLVPCIAAGAPEGGVLVLIDGYRRVSALTRVGADTALVQCWPCPVGQAITRVLVQSCSRTFDPIEEALLLRELIDSHGLSQREAARQCARDVSWVQRRLMLLDALPQELVQAVRSAQVSSWAAARILAPLARANSAHAVQLLHSLAGSPLSTRELQVWFERPDTSAEHAGLPTRVPFVAPRFTRTIRARSQHIISYQQHTKAATYSQLLCVSAFFVLACMAKALDYC